MSRSVARGCGPRGIGWRVDRRLFRLLCHVFKVSGHRETAFAKIRRTDLRKPAIKLGTCPEHLAFVRNRIGFHGSRNGISRP